MKAKLAAVIYWIKTHRTRTIIVMSLFLIAGSGGATYALLSQPLAKLDMTQVKVSAPPKPVYSTLTGLKLDSETDNKKPVTAIIIENSPDARPQSGLKDAEIVYEAIAEAGITRFMSLYQQNKPSLIGPVRSLRPYYLDWVVPYDASIAHVGGSSKALTEVRSGKYRDIDQFFNADTFWRASDRYAPHNVYTSFEKLDAINKAKKYSSSSPTGFKRDDVAALKAPIASSINVQISSATFNSSYTYDAKSETYRRSQAGAPHLDREAGQIAPKIVIVMNANESTQFEDTNREVIQTVGQDNVTIFQGGDVIKGTWKHDSRSEQLQFFDTEGNVIPLARGLTWITVIPNGRGSVNWQ